MKFLNIIINIGAAKVINAIISHIVCELRSPVSGQYFDKSIPESHAAGNFPKYQGKQLNAM